MTSNSLRNIALGILLATGVSGAVYFLEPSEASSTEKVEETEKSNTLSINQLKEELIAEGYIVQTEKEWNEQLSVSVDEAVAKHVKENESKETKEQNDTVVYRTMISVASGMTSIDVGRALEQTNIIENAFEFSQAVEAKGLANALKPGMYEVESGMSQDKIISTIFQ